jgi:hypothetical protein
MFTSQLDPDLFRPTFKGQSIMVPQLLRSGVFALSAKSATGAATRAVPKFDDISDSTRGAAVEYVGAPLLQYDLRVLLGLLHLAGGMHADYAELKFDAVEFLTSIGKKDTSSRSIDALRKSMARLRSAVFVVKDFAKDRGMTIGLLADLSWDMRKCLVKLSPMLQRALHHGQRTYLPMAMRNQLADGVQTALADILYATTCESLDINALAAVWGRESHEIGREVREALAKLQEVGMLTQWSATRGRVHVKRAVQGKRGD